MLDNKAHRLFWENTIICIRSVRLHYVQPLQPLLYDKLPSSVFLFLCQGRAGIELGDDRLAAERFFALHAGAGARLALYPERRECKCYVVEYGLGPEASGKGLPDAYLDSYGFIPELPLTMTELMDKLLQSDRSADTLMQQAIAKGHFYRFVELLLDQLESSALPEPGGDSVSEALQYIHLHYEDEISLEQLADQADSSPRHLGRQFKERMGVSPIDYVIHLRMKKAKRLLASTDASLQEIAESLGYSDSYAFAKMFKKQTGMPPIGYRDLHRRRDGAPTSSSQDVHMLAAASRSVQTSTGSVKVPLRPERVVVLYLIGDVLACGVVPVGISDLYQGASFEAEAAGIPQVGPWYAPDLEAIAALKPDLIVVPSEKTWQQIRHIAPTVCIDAFHDSAEQLATVNASLGRSLDVWSRTEHLLRLAERCKDQLRQAGLQDRTVTIVEGGLKGMSVVCSKWAGRGSQALYHFLGMKAPAFIQSRIDYSGKGNNLIVPLENLASVAGDFLIRSSYPGMDDLSVHEVWRSLPAVNDGRLIELDFGLLYYPDTLSMEQQIVRITERLLNCADRGIGRIGQ